MLIKVVFLVAVLLCILQSGCGMVSLMGTPASHEIKIPAEYDLAEAIGQNKRNAPSPKLLILVVQPAWVNSNINLRVYLTDAIRRNLQMRAKIAADRFIAYDKLSAFRSGRADFGELSAVEIGKELGANKVLLVKVDRYQITKIPDVEYYRGLLFTQSALFDTATEDKLWPGKKRSRNIKVGFDIEKAGPQMAGERLASSCAYCITRYLYDCQKAKFKIADELIDRGWEKL